MNRYGLNRAENRVKLWYVCPHRGATSSSFRWGAIFMKFHSMTSSWWFNRATTFSQTVTD